jgi:ABC-type sugar transport system substrate-binding protein
LPNTLKIGLLPKSTRNPYFQDCRNGAEEAARHLGFDLRWEGPEQPDDAVQIEVVRRWIAQGVPVIAASVHHSPSLSPVLRDARALGIKVLTWDADGDPDARDFTIVPATAQSVAHALAFEIARLLGGEGTFAVITSSLTAPNQRAWLAELKARLGRDYPGVQLVAVKACEDLEERARAEATQILSTFPGVRAFVGLCSPAVPGAAAAVAGRSGPRVHITGVSLPSLCRRQIEAGAIDSVVIWSARRLGYLAAAAAHAVGTGTLARGASTLTAGELGTVIVRNDEIRLGRVHIVTAGNVGQFVAGDIR